MEVGALEISVGVELPSSVHGLRCAIQTLFQVIPSDEDHMVVREEREKLGCSDFIASYSPDNIVIYTTLKMEEH